MKKNYCQLCFEKNTHSTNICQSCGSIIEPVDRVTKEGRMRAFDSFFMEYPIVREDGEASQRRQKKFEVQRGIIIYDMGSARVEWGWFVFFTLLMVLPGIKYLYERRSHLVLCVEFNELGYPLRIQDTINSYQYRHILELYMEEDEGYRVYVDKNPKTITKKGYTKKQLILLTIGMLFFVLIILPGIIGFVAYLRFQGVF